MRYIILPFLLIQLLFSQNLSKKIMVTSSKTEKKAQEELNRFNELTGERVKKLQEELNFEIKARPSGKFYVLVLEPFENYSKAKIVLDEIKFRYTDAYISKYTQPKKSIDTKKNENLQIKEENQNKLIKNLQIKESPSTLEEEETTIKNQEPIITKKVQEIKDGIKEKENNKMSKTFGQKYFMIKNSQSTIRNNIKKNLSVYPLLKDSSIIRVEYKDFTAQRSTEFVNELLKVYLDQNINENSKQLRESLAFIETQLNKAKEELELSEKELELFRSNNLLFNIDKKVEQINKQKDELQKELLSVERQKSLFNSVKEALLKGEMISSGSFNDSTLTDNIKQLNLERNLQQEFAAKYTPSHKKMIAIKDKIASLEDGIIKNVKNIDISLKENKKSLKEQIHNLNEEILLLPNLAMELAKLERRFSLKESVYKDLLLKYNDTSSKYISSKRVNRIIDYAIEPQTPIKPKKMIIFALGFMGALLFGFIAVLIKEYFDIYIKRPSDLLNISKTPYFGYIPFVKTKNYNKLFILDDLSSDESESLRRIRSSLELTGQKNNSRVILTTSTVSNEGKSTFIANLAVILALTEKKTIILGLDLRIPQLHLKFDINNKKGMSDLLANNIKLNEVIQSVNVKDKSSQYSLDIIPSGNIPPNPSELIENGTLDNIIEELRKSYDYILIDSTPVAMVPDSLSLLNKADTTLFIVKSEYSKKEYIKSTDELIKKYNLKSAGFVLTSVKKKYYETIKYDKNYNLFASRNS